MDRVLEVSNLTITHRATRRTIVKDISFSAYKGRTLCIVGESGSGKTMTCKAILQLLNRNIFEVSGSVLYKNIDLLNQPDKSRGIIGKDITLIMQNPMNGFNPVVRIGKQVTETIKAHHKTSRSQAYEMGIAALKRMNLPRPAEIMHSFPHVLSGGMLQRIMIAIALMLGPEVVIADEATTALDVNTQAIVLAELENIRDIGMALIVVTHDFGVVAQMADDVMVMHEGEIVENATVYDVFDNPTHPYTKELLNARILTDGRRDA